MNPNILILIGLLAGGTIVLLVWGLFQVAGRRRAALAKRVETYTAIEEEAAAVTETEMERGSALPRILHVLLGGSYMQHLEADLAQADIPVRASEYVLLRLVLAGVGYMMGAYGFGNIISVCLLTPTGFFIPAIFVRIHKNRRRAKFVRQLADALMLLTNSLRAGYGFLKGLELVAKEMDAPISKELNRTLREINLGATIDQALTNLGKRVNSRDLDIVVSAFLIQKDVGGNLTEIMEKVAETIRERLRIQGDIRVLTAQGRLSGLIVGLLPVVLFFFFLMRAPDYFKAMFGPPTMQLGGVETPVGVLMLVGALVWQIIGGYFIHKIITIKV